jgi:hypothetical protein
LETPGTAVQAARIHNRKIVIWRITPFPKDGDIILKPCDRNFQQTIIEGG